MNWSTRFRSHPQFGQAVQFATGRPAWVLKATGLVAAVVFAVPLIALAVLMIAALAVTAVAWIVFNALARVIDALGGSQTQRPGGVAARDDEGRENVRVIQRP